MLTAFYILAGIASIVGVGIPLYFAVDRFRKRNGISWPAAFRVAEVVLTKIEQSGWRPDILVGVGRSGAIWGGWLAGNLGSLPIVVIDKKYSWDSDGRRVDFPNGKEILTLVRDWVNPNVRGRKLRILIVEGAASNGLVVAELRRHFSTILSNCDVRFAILYKHPVVSERIDYIGNQEEDIWPKRFPWHHRDAYQRQLDSTGVDFARPYV